MPATQFSFEAWTTPESGDYRKICDIDVALHGSSGVRELSGWTNGRLLVPAWWEKTDDLVTDTSGCMVLTKLGDAVVDEFKATRVTKPDKRPSQRALTGPQINGIVEGLAVFPYNWPNQTEGALDWIWGGENALPDLRLASLGNISATYELYLVGERYELDISLATTGDFTLGYNGNNTSAIAYDATHSDIKSAVESLPGITEVTVLQPDPDTAEFFLVFENPKDLSPDLTANFAGTGGLGNLTKMNDGFDTGTDPTFTIEVDGDTTEALDWDISENGLEGTETGGTGLQGLSTVSDVTVSGSGTADDPWIITFYDPASPGSVSATFAAGSYSLTRTQAGALDPGRITQSRPVDQGAGSEEVYGSYDNPALEVDTSVTNGGDYSIKVNVAGRYGGSQVVVDVTPGQTYQVSIPIRKSVTGLHTLVLRDTAENLIAQTSPRDNSIAADGSFHDLEIADVVIPPGVSQVVMREANTDPAASTWAHHWADWENAQFTEGQPPATPTKIIRQLVEAAQDRSAFEFLDLDFTDSVDSAGTSLDEINFTAFFGAGANLAVILSNLHRSGYEWRVVRKATPVGSLTHDLQFWAPGGGPEDLTSGGGGPSILAGSGTSGAEVVRRAAPFTALLAHGLGSLVKEDTNATTLAAQGRIERVLDAEHLSSDAALQAFLDAQFDEEEVNRLAATASVRADAQAVPLIDYGEGSKVWWQFPGGLLDKEARRVRRIGWVHGSTAEFTVQGSKILTEEAAIRQALDRLLNEFRRRRSEKKVTTQAAGGTSGSVGAHIHLLRSTTQSIDAAGTAISWESEWPYIGRENFAAVSGTQIVIQEPGYYNVEPEAYMAAAVSSPEVWVTRTRAGAELRVWPPEESLAWAASHSAQEFTPETAAAIPCLSGDIIQVYIAHGEGSAQDLDFAAVSVYLVDRTVPEVSGDEIYRDLILSQGPIAYWRLGEDSELSLAYDETGNGHAGEYSVTDSAGMGRPGAIAGTDNTAIGYAGGGASIMRYDGTEGSGALADFDVSEISVKAWVKTSVTSGVNMIVSRLNEGTASTIWDLYTPSGSGAPRFRSWDPGASVEVSASTSVADGEWHHVVGTYDGSNLKIYVDGVLEGTTAAAGRDLTGSAHVQIGYSVSGFGFPGFFWDGDEDEVAIWGRALSLSEIQAQNLVGRSG